MNQNVDSTSDERTVNNIMRHQYRVLSDDEKEQMQAVKDKGLEFVELLHSVGKTDENWPGGEHVTGAGQTSRELALAQTKLEEAVMWAVKHITG